MENDHSIPFDALPKRRKHKDNPYTIRTSGIHTDHPRYFLEFQDAWIGNCYILPLTPFPKRRNAASGSITLRV